LTEEELRNWQEIDMHLSELARSNGWVAFSEYVMLELSKPISTRVLNASEKAYSWETYLRDTGYLKGLKDVLEIPAVVNAKVVNELKRLEERGE
jgi:hypothetical protein